MPAVSLDECMITPGWRIAPTRHDGTTSARLAGESSSLPPVQHSTTVWQAPPPPNLEGFSARACLLSARLCPFAISALNPGYPPSASPRQPRRAPLPRHTRDRRRDLLSRLGPVHFAEELASAARTATACLRTFFGPVPVPHAIFGHTTGVQLHRSLAASAAGNPATS